MQNSKEATADGPWLDQGGAPQPIHFEANVLYPMVWLECQLGGIMSLQVFLTNLGLQRTGNGRMFQNALWGHEILQAMQKPLPELHEQQVFQDSPQMTRKKGRPRKYI